MANDRNLKVNLSVTADTKEAQQKMKSLIDSLDNLKIKPQISIDDKVTKDLTNTVNQVSGALQNAFNMDTGKLDLSRFSLELKKADLDIKTIQTDFRQAGAEGREAFLQLSQQIMMAETPVLNLNKNLKEFAGTLANTFRWQVSSSFLHGAIGSIQSAINYAKELDDSLNKIQIVTGNSDAEMAKFAESANKAAQALSTTTNRYAEASLIYFQQGLNAKEVEERAAITVKMANVTGDTAETVSQQLTSVWNNFYDGSKSLEYFADGMTALGAATATSSAEIAQGLQKFSSIGETVGLSYEYAASALATITATTRESADTVGNALKSLFARIEGLNLGETAEDGTTLNKYSAALAKVGVNIKDANGQLKDMDQILDELGERWQTLGRDQQVALAQTVAGQRQYAQLMTLMNNWDFMKENLKTVESSSGTLQKQADIYAKSWEAASTRVRATLEEIYDKLLDANFFVDLSNAATLFLNILSDVIDGLGGVPGILTLISSIFLQHYAKEIPTAINTVTNTFALMTGKAKEAALTLQQETSESLEKFRNSNIGKQYDFEIEKIQILGKLKQDYNSKVDQLSASEQAQYESLIKNVDKTLEKMRELKETQDELLVQQNKAKANTALSKNKGEEVVFIDENQTQTKTLREIREEFIETADVVAEKTVKIEQAKKIWEEGFSKVGVEDDFKELSTSVEKLFADLKEGGVISEETFNKLGIAIKDADGSTDLLIGNITELFGEIEAEGVEGNRVLANFINILNKGGPNAKALAQALLEYKDATIEAERGSTQYKDTLDALNKKIQESTVLEEKRSVQIGKAVSDLASVASSYMSLNRSIQNFGDIDVSIFDKITTFATSLPMLIHGFNSLTNLLSKLPFGLSAFAGPIGIAITAIGALVSAFQAVSKAQQEFLDKEAEATAKIAESTKARSDEAKKEYEANQDLIKEYDDLLKQYEDNKTGKEDLINVGTQLAEAYDLESEKIRLLEDDYDGLIQKIKEKKKEQLEDAAREGRASIYASQQAFESQAKADRIFEKQTSYNTEDDYNYGQAIATLRQFAESDNLTQQWAKMISTVQENIDWRQGSLFITDETLAKLREKLDPFFDQVLEDYGTNIVNYTEEEQREIQNKFTQLLSDQEIIVDESTLSISTKGLNDKLKDRFQKDLEESLGKETISLTFGGFDLSLDENTSLLETVNSIQDLITEIEAMSKDEKILNFGGTEEAQQYIEFLSNIFSPELLEQAEKYKEALEDGSYAEILNAAFELLPENVPDIGTYNSYIKSVYESVEETMKAMGKESTAAYAFIEEIIRTNGLVDEKFSDNFKILENYKEKLSDEFSPEAIQAFYESLGEDAQNNLEYIDFETAIRLYFNYPPEQREQELNALKTVLDKQAKEAEKVIEAETKNGAIAEALASLENINLTKTTSAENFKKLESQLSWGENGLIPWDEFAKKDRDSQISYLAQAKIILKEAQEQSRQELIAYKESQIKTLEGFQRSAEKVGLTSLATILEERIEALKTSKTKLEQESAQAAKIEEESARSIVQAIKTSQLEVKQELTVDQVNALELLGIDVKDFAQKLNDGSAILTKDIEEFIRQVQDVQLTAQEKLSGLVDITKLTSYDQVKQLRGKPAFSDEDYEAAVRYLYVTGQLKLSLEDLNDEELKGFFDEKTWKELTSQIELSEEKTEDLLERLKRTEAGETFKLLLDEILSREDLTTVQTIEAIIDALKKGVYSAGEFIDKTKEYLTAQEQLIELRSRATTEKDFSGYASLAGNEDLSFEDRSEAIEGMVESIDKLKESGKHANEEMKQLYDIQQSLLESNDSEFTMAGNLQELAEALEKGTLDLEHYEEAMRKLLTSERDWSMSEDVVAIALIDLEVLVNKANGTLEKNAITIGETCESMEDYEILLTSLDKHEASSEVVKKATASALLKLAKNYDECKEEMHKYEAALRSGDQELQKSTKSALEFAIRCSEIAKNTGKTQAEIKSLAQSYKDLYQTIDESGQIMDISDEVAADLAERYININEGIKDLQQNWEGYTEVLDDLQQAMDPTNAMTLNDVYVDQADKLENLRNAMAQVLNMTDASAISNEFLAMNADLVSRAMEGEAAAVEELQIRMAEKLMLEVGIDDTEFQEIANSVGMTCDDIRSWMTNLPEGQLSLDNMQFLQALIDAMNAAGMSREDIENKLSGIGFDLDLEPLNQDLQDAVDNVDTAGEAVVNNVEKAVKAAIEAGAVDSEATIQTQDYTEKQQGIDWKQVEDPITVHGTFVKPFYRQDPVTGITTFGGYDTIGYDQTYPGIKVEPIVKEGEAQKKASGVGLRLKSGSYSKGGNISFKNSSGGNKPSSTSTSSTPRSSSSSPRTTSTSAPRATQVSGSSVSAIKTKTFTPSEVDTVSMEDYRQKKVQKDLPNLQEYADDIYINRKRYYNERYAKDEVYEDKDYVTKDSSLYKNINDEIELYYDENRALEKLSNQLQEIEMRKSRAFGKAHLDAIEEEKNNIQKTIDTQEQLLSSIGDRRAQVMQTLSQYGVIFNDDGTIANYAEVMTQEVTNYNRSMEKAVDDTNRSIQTMNSAMHESTDRYNQENRNIVDAFNQGMNEIYSNYNDTAEHVESTVNRKSKLITDTYNAALLNAADNEYDAKVALNSTYEDIVGSAATKRNSILQQYADERDMALAEAGSDLERSLSTLQAQYNSVVDQYSGYYSDSDRAEWAKSEIAAAKDLYDREKERLENDYDVKTHQIETDYKLKTKAVKDDFEETEKIAKNQLNDALSDTEQAQKIAQRDATHVKDVMSQRLEAWKENEIRTAEDLVDSETHELENRRKDAEEANELRREAEEKEIKKAHEKDLEYIEQDKQAAQQRIDTVKNAMQEIDEINQLYDSTLLQMQENRNRLYDLNLEAIDYTVNLKVRLSDEVVKALDSLLDSLGDFADKATDKIAILGSKMYQFAVQTNATRDAIRDLLNSTELVDSTVIARFMNGSYTEDDLQALFNVDQFTEDKVAQLEGYRDSLISLISEQRSLKNEMFDTVMTAFNEYQEKLDLQIEKISTLTKFTETYRNIIGIVGKKVLDASGELSEKLARNAFDTQRSQTKVYKTILDELDSNIADMKYKQRNYDIDSEMYRDFQQRIDEMEAKRRSAQENWLSSWQAEMQAAADYYADAIDTITMVLDRSVSGLMDSLELLRQEYDRQKQISEVYVEDYEKIYQLNKLNRQIEAAIDDSEHIKNKQRLKKLQEQINAANQDGVKLSQYDLDVLQKKFELEMARSELEEATNAKSQVRMMRDAEGNYGFVYTADANAVADAEQNYEDKLHELQVLNTDYIKQLEENYLQLQQNVRDQLANLDITQFATEEEYLAEVNRIQQAALELQKRYGQQMTNATNNNQDLYNNDWKTYSEMTGYKISADKDYLDKFQETQTAVLTGFKSMEEQHQVFADSIASATASMIEAYRATQEMQKVAMQDGDTSMNNFATDAARTIDNVGTQTEKLANEAVTLSEKYRDSFSDIADNAGKFADNYVKNIQPVIDANQKLLTTISDIISHQADLGGIATSTSGGSGGQNSGTTSSGSSMWTVSTTQAESIGAKSRIGEYLPFIGAILQFSGYDTNYGGWGAAGTNERTSKLISVFGEGVIDDIDKWMNEHYATDSVSYWTSIRDNLEKYSYQTLSKIVPKYDTGGYTGIWGPSGKLAMLHEKELVLNKEDTANILETVDIVRNIAQVIDLNARATNQAMSTAFNAASVSNGNQVFEQQVTINADFPNATDRDEIIAAFDNLTNLAMQYAGRA